jgi:hypothetical protein
MPIDVNHKERAGDAEMAARVGWRFTMEHD